MFTNWSGLLHHASGLTVPGQHSMVHHEWWIVQPIKMSSITTDVALNVTYLTACTKCTANAQKYT